MTASELGRFTVFFAIFVAVWLLMSALFGDSISGNIVPALLAGALTTAIMVWQNGRRDRVR